MRIQFLPGSLVYLRPWERGDAREMVAWVNNPEVTRTLLVYRPMGVEAEEKYIEHVNASDSAIGLAIVEKGSDRLVGSVGLQEIHPQSRNAQFGILVGDPLDFGKGFGTEATRLIVRYAFDTLNLHRVWLQVTANNPSAIHVYEKVGFKREGILRQAHYREGCYIDLVVMGMLRGELIWS